MDNKQLEQVSKYWDCFNKGDYVGCKSIVWIMDKSLITAEMFYKALEVEHYYLCWDIILRAEKSFITKEMCWEMFRYEYDAYDIANMMMERAGFNIKQRGKYDST